LSFFLTPSQSPPCKGGEVNSLLPKNVPPPLKGEGFRVRSKGRTEEGFV